MNEGRQGLIVRRATEADLDSIVKLGVALTTYHLKFDEYYKFKENIEEKLREFHTNNISSENTLLLVAEIDDAIVGFTLGKIKKTPPILKIEEFGHLSDTFVKEELRRKRIGERLTYELLE